jgi:hypothetical protein
VLARRSRARPHGRHRLTPRREPEEAAPLEARGLEGRRLGGSGGTQRPKLAARPAEAAGGGSARGLSRP